MEKENVKKILDSLNFFLDPDSGRIGVLCEDEKGDIYVRYFTKDRDDTLRLITVFLDILK